MRTLIIGGSGFLGRPLVRALLDQGWEVTVFALSASGLDPRARYQAGDRHNPADLRTLARTGAYDAVLDLVAYRPDETAAMVELWRGAAGRFVHLSTASVYQGSPNPAVSEENAHRWPRADGTYGAEKAACERVLEEAGRRWGFPFVILRPAPVMGPGDPASRENYFLKRIRSGRPILYPAEGVETGVVTLLYLADLVQAFMAAAAHPGVTGRAYHLAQSERPTLREHVANIAQMVGREAHLVPAPSRDLLAAGFHLFAFPYGPRPPAAWLDLSRATAALGFRPTPYPQALAETVSWYERQDSGGGGGWPSGRVWPSRRVWPAWPGRGARQSRMVGTHEELHAELEEHFLRGAACGGRSAALPAPGATDPAFGAAEAGVASPGPADATEPPPGRADGAAFWPRADAVLALLAGEQAGPEGLRVEPVDWAPQAPLRPAWVRRSGGEAAALLEPTGADQGAGVAWLFVRGPVYQRFGDLHGVVQVRLCGFQDLDPDAVPPGQRLLVRVDGEHAAGFQRWLSACRSRGTLRLNSLAAYSRVFLIPPASGGGGREPWTRVYDLARLLCAADAAPAEEPLTLRLAGPGKRLQPEVLLVQVADRHYLADLARRRLLAISPPMALVTRLLVQDSHHSQGAPAALAEALGLSSAQADRVYRHVQAQLAELNLLRPVSPRPRGHNGR